MMKNITTVCTKFTSGSLTLLAVAEIPPGAPHAGVDYSMETGGSVWESNPNGEKAGVKKRLSP